MDRVRSRRRERALSTRCRARQTPDRSGVLVARVSDIHTVVTRLKGAGIEFVRDVHEVHPGAYSADFRDAEGNMVSLYALDEG